MNMSKECELPKVSVIVPIYNVSKYLNNCIMSILNQSYKNFELLLVDDGSTDDSLSICNKYAERDKRIIVLHKVNGGVSSARNMGIDYSSGDFIAFVDGDDTITKNALSIMVKEITDNDADMCVFPNIIINQKKVMAWKIDKGLYNNYECIDYLMNQRFPTSLWCCIYKRELLATERLNTSIHHLEDLEFQFRILCGSQYVYVSDKTINNYVQRSGSANSSGITKKLLTCLKVTKTVKHYVSNNQRLKKEYIGQIQFRLVMTICAKYLMNNCENKKMERMITKCVRNSLMDVLKCNNKKMIIQCLMVSTSFKLYAYLYKFKHKQEN